MQRVEDIRAVAAVEEVDPALAAGVRLGPARAVVPLVVDLNAHGLALGLDVHRLRVLRTQGDTFSRYASVRGLGGSESPPAVGATTACARARARGRRARGAAAPLRAPDALSARGVVTRAESADADMVKAAIAIATDSIHEAPTCRRTRAGGDDASRESRRASS